jgi:hypothetical protein
VSEFEKDTRKCSVCQAVLTLSETANDLPNVSEDEQKSEGDLSDSSPSPSAMRASRESIDPPTNGLFDTKNHDTPSSTVSHSMPEAVNLKSASVTGSIEIEYKKQIDNAEEIQANRLAQEEKAWWRAAVVEAEVSGLEHFPQHQSFHHSEMPPSKATETAPSASSHPEYYDFNATSSAAFLANHLKLTVDVPLLREADKEIAVSVQLDSSLIGTKVAIWLKRENEIGPGHEDFRYWSGDSRLAKLQLDDTVRSCELCVRPDYARNWYWSIDIPIDRLDPKDNNKANIIIDNRKTVDGSGVVLEGYQPIQITNNDHSAPQMRSIKREFRLDVVPCKRRAGRARIVSCSRRQRVVSEFTLQVDSERFGRETWNIHGGDTLSFGKDKPLPNRANENDLVFRPHPDESIWSQVSRTHGTFEISGSKLRYNHSSHGTNNAKQTWVRFSNGKITKVKQPRTFDLPDPTELVQFWPKLSVDIDKSNLLQVQAWRASDQDYSRYTWLPHSRYSLSDSISHGHRLGGMRLDVINPKLEVLRQHFLISKSLTIGSHPNAEITCRGEGIEAFHAYIHWIDDQLWIEPHHCRCSIEINGKSLHVDQLFPLEKNIELKLGSATRIQVLPFDANASLGRYGSYRS